MKFCVTAQAEYYTYVDADSCEDAVERAKKSGNWMRTMNCPLDQFKSFCTDATPRTPEQKVEDFGLRIKGTMLIGKNTDCEISFCSDGVRVKTPVGEVLELKGITNVSVKNMTVGKGKTGITL